MKIDKCLGVAQSGSAPDLDSGGRWFKSIRLDQYGSVVEWHTRWS